VRRNCNDCRVIRRALGLLPGVLTLCLILAGSATAGPTAVAAGCSIPHQGEHLGPTYLTALSVSGTSCSMGLTVVREYHSCQLKHGGVKGTCSSAVDGFRCTEKRGPSIPTEFFSSVSCADGSKHVSYKYSQFT
jgi:hypothetical protein